MNPELPFPDEHSDRYLDFMRDVIKVSVYKCSCGFRAYGMPVSAHELKYKDHGSMIREEIVERGKVDGFTRIKDVL